eukprot:g11010.t1
MFMFPFFVNAWKCCVAREGYQDESLYPYSQNTVGYHESIAQTCTVTTGTPSASDEERQRVASAQLPTPRSSIGTQTDNSAIPSPRDPGHHSRWSRPTFKTSHQPAAQNQRHSGPEGGRLATIGGEDGGADEGVVGRVGLIDPGVLLPQRRTLSRRMGAPPPQNATVNMGKGGFNGAGQFMPMGTGLMNLAGPASMPMLGNGNQQNQMGGMQMPTATGGSQIGASVSSNLIRNPTDPSFIQQHGTPSVFDQAIAQKMLQRTNHRCLVDRCPEDQPRAEQHFFLVQHPGDRSFLPDHRRADHSFRQDR